MNKDFIKKYLREWGAIALAILVFVAVLILSQVYNWHDLAFQLASACVAALLTMLITRMLLEAQSHQQEEVNRSIHIHENKVRVYSSFVQKMWKTLDDEELEDKEMMLLRSEIFSQLIFYLNPGRIPAMEKCVKMMFVDPEEEDMNSEKLKEKQLTQFAKITEILQEDLDGKPVSTESVEKTPKKGDISFSSSLIRLWRSFQPRQEMQKDDAHEEVNLNFWHFNALGKQQFKALKNGIFELSLIEYNGDKWRTNLLKQVKIGDIVFLYRAGGYGYVGMFRVKGYRIFDYSTGDLKECINENGVEKIITPVPEKDLTSYDFYDSIKDDADFCSNLIVEPLAYYAKGIPAPGNAVYRRTISRYQVKEYIRELVTTFAGKKNELSLIDGYDDLRKACLKDNAHIFEEILASVKK